MFFIIFVEMFKFVLKIFRIFQFTQNIELRDRVLLTDSKELDEASSYDKIWGVGLRINDPRIANKHPWRGRNLLGQILVDVRDKIKNKDD